ncbi:pentatricopeptide repeat-containing protein At2g13600-like [Aristolochia californica]|uniref:pentatricopeptide repeat-containing protein At2g13600-like n=1 Tax=Aristolochia californica TaxID=171875 RepID=UPI0035E1EE35
MIILAFGSPRHNIGRKLLLSSRIRCMLSSCAHQMFDEIPQIEASKIGLFSGNHIDYLNSAVIGLAKNGRVNEVLRLFYGMNGLNLRPTKYALCAVLSSCSKLLDHQLGLQIHARIIQVGHEENIFLSSALIDIYAKCGEVADARRLFDEMKEHDQVSWTSIISGLSQNGKGQEALVLFKEMLASDVTPNCSTFASAVSACTIVESTFVQGSLLHAQVIKHGFQLNSFVLSSLVDVYAKCGQINQARLLFDESDERDIILYNSMIAAFSQNLHGAEALKLFVEIQRNGTGITDFSCASVLNACGSVAVLQHGLQIQSLVTKMGSDQNVYVSCALIDMYSKCGRVNEARRVFDHALNRNSILWTSMLHGYAISGQGEHALQLFDELTEAGMRPDHICFTSVLTACNHEGLLDRGIHHFNLMKNKYGLFPQLDQYACMVDLYGRKGCLMKAKELIEEMPFEPTVVIWSSFLGSCRVHGEIELGKEAAYHLFELEPHAAGPYLALGNLYSNAGMWNEAAEVKRLMECRGSQKRAGWSKIELE